MSFVFEIKRIRSQSVFFFLSLKNNETTDGFEFFPVQSENMIKVYTPYNIKSISGILYTTTIR